MLNNLMCKQNLRKSGAGSWELKLFNFSPSSFQDNHLLLCNLTASMKINALFKIYIERERELNDKKENAIN